MTRSTSKQPFWCTGATVVSRGKRLRRLRALFSLEPRAAKAASWGLVSPCRGAVIAIAMLGKDVCVFCVLWQQIKVKAYSRGGSMKDASAMGVGVWSRGAVGMSIGFGSLVVVGVNKLRVCCIYKRQAGSKTDRGSR